MKLREEQSPIVSADQTLLAEVRALRDRVRIQQGLVDLLLERSRGQDDHHQAIQVYDPVPVHPLRGDSGSNENGSDFAPPDDRAEDRRLVPRGAAWWPVDDKPVPALRPNPGWAFSKMSPSAEVIGFSLSGMNCAEVEKAVELVNLARRQRPAFIPVFLTDCPDLSVFRRHGYVAEYLPPCETSDETPGAGRYDRQQLIKHKWNLSRIFEFNQAMREAALDSTFSFDSGPMLELQSSKRAHTRANRPGARRTAKKKPGKARLASTKSRSKRK
jgi:hypothetical protein